MSCRSCLSLAMQVLFGRKCLFDCKIAAYSSVPRCPHLIACNAVLHNENSVLPVRCVYISQERSIPNAVVLSSQRAMKTRYKLGSLKRLLCPDHQFYRKLRIRNRDIKQNSWSSSGSPELFQQFLYDVTESSLCYCQPLKRLDNCRGCF